MNYLIYLLIILTLYFSIILILNRKNILQKYNISFYGPALLLRTKKGIDVLRKISNRKKIWTTFGNFGIIFCFIMKDLPAGLNLYIFVSTLFGIVQQLFVYKYTD